MKYFLPLAFLALAQCAPDVPSNEEEAGQNIRLSCESSVDAATGIPFSDVYLLIDEQKIKVAEIGACESFDPSAYPDYDIPPNAVSTCGGAGDYLYVVQNGKSLKVFHGRMKEGQVGEGFHYEEVYHADLK